MSYGAVPLSETHNSRAKGSGSHWRMGDLRLDPPAVSHRILADGRVRLKLPASGVLTDGEAKRLAWGILNDLAPDETIPAAQFVTYKEAQRLATMRAILDGAQTINAIGAALGWTRRTVERRLRELRDDGRVEGDGPCGGITEMTFRVIE